MLKYVKIERLGSEENDSIFAYPDDELIITEKVDGGNSQIFVEDGVLNICSRNRNLTKEKDDKVFLEEREYLERVLEGKVLNPDFVYYGEFGKKHTLTYESLPKFVGFDIRVRKNINGVVGDFLDFDAMRKEFERLGLVVVPLLDKIKVKDFLLKEPSDYIGKSAYGETIMEGIVIKNYGRKNVWGRQMFAKVVRDEFREQNRATFDKLKSDSDNETVKLFDEFVTSARIRKQVLKLVNEDGRFLDNKLMKWLPNMVIEDMFIEEIKGILKNRKAINLRLLKQLVSKKCLIIIEEMRKE